MCPSCEAAHANARRSADAAVRAAHELGAVASQAREALRELLTATVERDEAEAAHTNAGSPAARQRMMREAGTARQRYTDAVDAAARALGVDVGALRAARAAAGRTPRVWRARSANRALRPAMSFQTLDGRPTRRMNISGRSSASSALSSSASASPEG